MIDHGKKKYNKTKATIKDEKWYYNGLNKMSIYFLKPQLILEHSPF